MPNERACPSVDMQQTPLPPRGNDNINNKTSPDLPDNDLIHPERRLALSKKTEKTDDAESEVKSSSSMTMAQRLEQIDPQRFYSMCSTLISYEEEKKHLSEKNKELQAQNDELREKSERSQEEHENAIQDLREERDAKQHEVDQAREELNEYQATLERCRASMDAYSAEETRLTEMNTSLQEELQLAKQGQSNEYLQALQRRNNELARLLDEADQQKDQYARDSKNAKKEFKSAENTFKQEVKGLREEKEKDAETIEELSRQRELLGENYKGIVLLKDQLVQELKDARQGNEQLVKDLQEAKLQNEQLAKDVAEAKQEREGAKSKLEQKRLRDENEKLIKDFADLKQRNEQLAKDLKDARQQDEQLAQNATNSQENGQLAKDLAEARRQNEQLAHDLQDGKQRAEIAENRIKLEQKKHADRIQEIRTKDIELESLRKGVREKQELSQKLTRKENELRESITHLRTVHRSAKYLQVESAYAQRCLKAAHEESDEYAFANIWALVQQTSHSAPPAAAPAAALASVSPSPSQISPLEQQLAALQRTLKARDEEIAQLKAEKVELEKELAQAWGRVTNGDTEAKTSKKEANVKLDKLQAEQKELRKKYESVNAAHSALTQRYSELYSQLNEANAGRDVLNGQKETLTTRVAALQIEVGTAKQQAKRQADGLQSQLDAARADAARLGRELEAQRPKKQKYIGLDDIEWIFQDNTEVHSRINEIYKGDPDQRLEVRVDGKILPHTITRTSAPADEGVEEEVQLDGPLEQSNELMMPVLLGSKPWSLSLIEDVREEQEGSESSEDAQPEASADGAEEGEIQENEVHVAPTACPTVPPPTPMAAQETPVAAASVPTGPHSTTQPTAATPSLAERLQKSSFNQPVLPPIEIPAEQSKKQPGRGSLPTPAPSDHASPRDSVLATPRSPVEGNSPVYHKLPKRPVSTDASRDPRPPKRHAPETDAVNRAPRQPRSFDVRSEEQQDRMYRPSYGDDHRRHSYDPRYMPRDPRIADSSRDGEREHERRRDPYSRRW